MEKLFLVTNPGSSSRKYALYRGDELVCSLHFEYEDDVIICTMKLADGTKQRIDAVFRDLNETASYVKRILTCYDYLNHDTKLDAILARVASSGDYFAADHVVDEECLARLEAAKQTAPLHVPTVAAEIEACIREFDRTPVLIISDSAFHNTCDTTRTYYAIDTALADRAEIKRYGYHGLSMGSVSETLRQHNLLTEKVVACHIGSGSSVTALLNGQSCDTTMGYTPLSGVMMATRCGDIDAMAALAIGRELNLDNHELEEYLNKQCGLRGVSGTSDDMRNIIALRDNESPRAMLAYEMFIWRIQRAIAQMTATLQGIDALVFTATIGERNAEIRHDIAAGLGYLGFTIDDQRNERGLDNHNYALISTAESKPIYIIQTDETGEMIRRARLLLGEDN